MVADKCRAWADREGGAFLSRSELQSSHIQEKPSLPGPKGPHCPPG